nr:MAG TPA: hypothetical protein [Caudoviricetes sp.]
MTMIGRSFADLNISAAIGAQEEKQPTGSDSPHA